MRFAGLLAGFAAVALFLNAEGACACDITNSITGDVTWSGTVRLLGQVVVEKGATLTIMPGAKIVFMPGKLDEEGLADSGMLVKGTLIAKGKPDGRIVFTSGGDNPKPGDWGEIKLFASVGSAFSNCDFSFGGWGLHIHDSDLNVEGCTFKGNSYGGIRLKGGTVEITGCRISGMDIGVRYWKGAPSIHHNTITGNKTGIFCREGGEKSVISFNNLYGNSEYDIKLGEAQKGDVDARNNWWGTAQTERIREKVYDKGREDYIGRVLFNPALDKEVAVPQ